MQSPKLRLADRKAELPGNEYPIMTIDVSKTHAGTADIRPAGNFRRFGVITSAHVTASGVCDRVRRFGSVEMLKESGERAHPERDGRTTDSMMLRVNKAKARS